ncbi:PEP-CTERM sorting domain-containing protein [Crateriforma spongiae]|uniref:PEP-CTERM sorting domain-containing protein n=1 Tax=Crateriforma spongiae TaxID=2724528 RepID=UPI00144665D2|nr:PEP-CTERM sorting domain-containing protein [Crateriforma spongiae]
MRPQHYAGVVLAMLLLMTGSAPAAVVIFQDEAAFTADLADSNNFGTVGEDLHGTSDLTGLSSQTSSGIFINGLEYSFTFREGVFDTSLGGNASVATGANLIGDIDTSGSSFRYEAGTTDQGGASIPAWGYDTDATASSSANTVALFDFTASPTDLLSFSLQAGDFEGGNAWSNVVAAYRADGTKIGEVSFDWPATAYGDGVTNFIGFGADEAIGYAAFFVGEDDDTGFGHTERIAVGDFKLGTSQLNAAAVPEPSSILTLTALGLTGAARIRRKRKQTGSHSA